LVAAASVMNAGSTLHKTIPLQKWCCQDRRRAEIITYSFILYLIQQSDFFISILIYLRCY